MLSLSGGVVSSSMRYTKPAIRQCLGVLHVDPVALKERDFRRAKKELPETESWLHSLCPYGVQPFSLSQHLNFWCQGRVSCTKPWCPSRAPGIPPMPRRDACAQTLVRAAGKQPRCLQRQQVFSPPLIDHIELMLDLFPREEIGPHWDSAPKLNK